MSKEKSKDRKLLDELVTKLAPSALEKHGNHFTNIPKKKEIDMEDIADKAIKDKLTPYQTAGELLKSYYKTVGETIYSKDSKDAHGRALGIMGTENYNEMIRLIGENQHAEAYQLVKAAHKEHHKKNVEKVVQIEIMNLDPEQKKALAKEYINMNSDLFDEKDVDHVTHNLINYINHRANTHDLKRKLKGVAQKDYQDGLKKLKESYAPPKPQS